MFSSTLAILMCIDFYPVNLVQTVMVSYAKGLGFTDPEFLNEKERVDVFMAHFRV